MRALGAEPWTDARTAGGASVAAKTIWQRLTAGRAARPEPQYLDVTVRVRRVAALSTTTRLVLEVFTDTGERLGRAWVFPNEWYPGCQRTVPFSHYFLALQRAFHALETLGRPPELRLQVLKAVYAGTPRPFVTLLKFILSPEHAVPGGQLEQTYQCPLSSFFLHFVGVSRDVLQDTSPPAFVAGTAIHRAYGRASSAFVRACSAEAAYVAYLEGVRASWIDDFAYLLLDRARERPTQLYRLPVELAPVVAARCRARWADGAHEGQLQLYQERLFFSPQRGLAGKADRIAHHLASGVHELFEVKTSTGVADQRDPRTGMAAPGGIQALAYHEIMRTLLLASEPGATGPARQRDVLLQTSVELLTADGAREVPLQVHPVVTRASADPLHADDRYLDLLAQSRNVAYLVESGLLTGYDRERISRLIATGQRLRGVGGDFELYAAWPPCRACAAQARRVCSAAHGATAPPWYDFFRHVPQRLYRYWAWFHQQLKQEDLLAKEHLFHLATTPVEELERREGISIAGLTAVAVPDQPQVIRLERLERIETRLREDDTVLLTPEGRQPGEMHSLEGTIVALDAWSVTVRVADHIAAGTRWRVDQFRHAEHAGWQVQGLTDFLLGSMFGASARGRAIQEHELPRLTRVVLGLVEPAGPHPLALSPTGRGGTVTAAFSPGKGQHDGNPLAPRTPRSRAGGAGPGVRTLNPEQQAAVAAALRLAPGELLLIQGPPGTGKTRLIAHLARALAVRDFWRDDRRPVLILANTHRACNEVVLRLRREFPDLALFVLRVGRAGAGWEPEVAEHVLAERLRVRERLHAIDMAGDGPATLHRLARAARLLHQQAAIFVGTLAAATAPELRGLAFETVIVDECGQATEPAALQALRHLPPGYQGRLVLVGDHRQLPPVVPDGITAPPVPDELRQCGFGDRHTLLVSLFERLARRYPQAVVQLRAQYRMNAEICRLISDTFYDGALYPATDAVARRTLRDVYSELGCAEPRAAGSAAQVFAPEPAVVVVDTSGDPRARDTITAFTADETRRNPREAQIVAALLAGWLKAFPREAARRLAERTGVIAAYRQQNNLIRQALMASLSGWPEVAEAVRVDTVDRFQGGEREVIVLSLVASNAEHSIGRLHADWRRMNVACSRARCKLVLVGDPETFTAPGPPAEEPAKAFYRRLFTTCRSRLPAAGIRAL